MNQGFFAIIDRKLTSCLYLENIVKGFTDKYAIYKQVRDKGYFKFYLVFLPEGADIAVKVLNFFTKRKVTLEEPDAIISVFKFEPASEDSDFNFFSVLNEGLL